LYKRVFRKGLLKKLKLREGGMSMKKVLGVVMALVMVLTLFVVRPLSVSAAGFKDVPADYWAKGQINYLVSKGVIAGYSDGTFKPEDPVTREQFAKMICIAKGLKEVKPATPTFKDVGKDRWSFGYVEAAVKAGYIKGYADGTFKPANSITRQELAVLGVRVLGKEKEANSITQGFIFANDEDQVAKWAVGAMTIAVRPKVQLLKWDNLRNIRPTAPATRAECAHAVYSILMPPGSMGKNNVINLSEQGPENFFPLTSDSAYTQQAVTYMQGGLIGETPEGVLYPDIATAVPSLKNGLLKVDEKAGTVETIFKFRKGVKWSDGQPVTAQDAVFAYQMIMNPKIQVVSTWPYDEITEIKALDDYTLYIKWGTLESYAVMGVPLYPKHILGPIYDKDPSLINSCDFVTKNPVYCGPYVLAEYKPDQYTIYKKNPNWYGGEPVIDTIIDKVITDTNAQFANMVAGGIDTGSMILTLDLADKVAQTMKYMKVLYNTGTSSGILNLNLSSDEFKDVRVRQALYYAIDRYTLTQKAMVGKEPMLSIVPKGTWAFEDVLSQYDYNPDKANELLDAAGWKWNADHTVRIMPNGKEASFKIPYATGAKFREREVTIMQPMLAKVGIKIDHAPMDFNALLDSETKGTFTITLHGISFDPFDPLGSMISLQSSQIPSEANGWKGQNVNRLNDPEMDKLVQQAINEGFKSQKERIPTLYKIQELWAKDVPYLLLESRIYPDFVRVGLQNWNHNFAGSVYFNWMCPYWYWDTNIG